MADFHADGHLGSGYSTSMSSEPAAPASMGRLVTGVGAALSLALVAGIGLWGYRMVMRDVSGVPVVRAMTGDTRRIPTDAGGQTPDYLGLAVNHVAAMKEAADAPDKVILAPQPIGLGDDALTEEEIAVRQRRATADASSTGTPALSTEDQLAARLSTEGKPLIADDETGEDGMTEDMASDAGSDERSGDLPTSTAHATGTMAMSVRPKARPTGLSSSQLQVIQASVAAPTPETPKAIPLSADSIAAGTQLVQLGAFSSEEVAISEWNRLNKDFDIYLAGKQRVIQRAESGGHIFYRLRAVGFSDAADTRRFCAALVAERADCIPVVTK